MGGGTQLAAADPDRTVQRRPEESGMPWGIRWRDLLVAVAAFGADLAFVGLLTNSLHTRLDAAPVSPAVVAGVVAVMASALLWRWQAGLPVLVYVLTITAGLIIWLEDSFPFVCVLVALYAAARQASRWEGWVALALGLVAVSFTTAAVVTTTDGPGGRRFVDVAFPAGVLTSVVVGVWIFGRRERAAAQQARALTTQIDQRAELATQAERERIARELHDILAHSVSAMMMQAAGAGALARTVGGADPEDERVRAIQEALSSIETTGSQSMRELHRLLGTSVTSGLGVVPSGPSDPPSLENVGELIDTVRHSGLIVEMHRSGPVGELDPSVGIAAYRTVQESLTNALKHLGRGTVVDIYESWDEQEVQVQVRCRGGHDDTRVDTPNGGLGLRGLRERVELAGGSFDAGWVGDEFVTTAVLPQSGGRSGAREDET